MQSCQYFTEVGLLTYIELLMWNIKPVCLQIMHYLSECEMLISITLKQRKKTISALNEKKKSVYIWVGSALHCIHVNKMDTALSLRHTTQVHILRNSCYHSLDHSENLHNVCRCPLINTTHTEYHILKIVTAIILCKIVNNDRNGCKCILEANIADIEQCFWIILKTNSQLFRR